MHFRVLFLSAMLKTEQERQAGFKLKQYVVYLQSMLGKLCNVKQFEHKFPAQQPHRTS